MAALDTNGYGGTTMIRAMLVVTNDPDRPEVRLEMNGDVAPRAYLSTDTVRLTGTAGTPIQQVVTITPTAGNPFKIKDITAQKGESIRFDLAEQQTSGGIFYQLAVSNTKTEKGWYLDKLHIHTDSPKTPEFTIKVFGVIRGD